MAVGTKNIQGSIKAYDFRIAFKTPVLSSNKQQVVLDYYGIANPVLTASITTYQYSTDNGTTWNTMTPSGDTTLSGLGFTTTGVPVSASTFTFKWEFKTDIGTNLYNNLVRVRLQATSGSLVTAYASYTLNFERTVTNVAQQQENIPFPSDYAGIPGTDLLENAPKIN